MQNEFEKQVQKKMEELDLVPSGPVWQKIEEQIRQKKDRRKLILWLPILFLFLGGGLWWLERGDGAEVSPAGIEMEPSGLSVQPVPTENKKATHINDGQAPEQSVLQRQAITEEKNIQKQSSLANNRSGMVMGREKDIRTGQKKWTSTERSPSTYHEATTRIPVQATSVDADRREESWDAPVDIFSDSERQRIRFIQNEKTPADPDKEFKPIPPFVAPWLTNAIVQNSSMQRKRSHSSWKLGLTADAGISASGKTPGLFGGTQDKSLDALAAASSFRPPLLYASAPPSSPESGPSFSLGIVARKRLGRHFHIATGLEYKFYSTRLAVGYSISQSTNFGNNSSAGMVYISSGSGPYNYENRFHFISLPLAADLRVSERFPLSLHAGFSVHRLINSNALRYQYASQFYYHDANAFSKTQLFSDLGLDYPVFRKKNTLLIGPHIQYGWTKLEQGNIGRHLFAMAMRVQYLLTKK
jgi:hypothetical protein